ncbi:mRNA 3'-end processing factor [Halogeometricum pallidum JCM 14848]|uniref:mRNA 3'-end processing factor n=1 Tax=Halogeometricum pallidum JCM 14848 TaxID=1227487 RepID=M0CZ98_HALPD|nr:MBL fold metallo-hydrolase RNA specificity domain-containing protein [Halogeometricum pallidum]ELZ28525.1 mRNA 3'-end processing factor [Halogeometricum pallidum JCM 14848]
MTVQYRDGIEITLSDGTRVVCDADDPPGSSADGPAGDVTVVSHAHGDHFPEGEATAVCSPLTADLASARREIPLHATTDDRIELLPAGHVAGSTAALVTDPDGTRYLYTGDVCTRSRFYLDGFEPPDADVLITETTYGEPEYVFPDHETVAADIVSWLRETDEPVILFGYALGRAQKLQLLAEEAGRERLFTTDAVFRVNDVVASHLDVSFGADRYEAETELGPGDALVLPMTTARIDWIRNLAEETGALKAGFSGWAVDDAFEFRGEFDETFPLSDHCDFAELRDLVDAVDPDRVYTQHGSTDAFAETLTRRGYEATALKRNQTALGDF